MKFTLITGVIFLTALPAFTQLQQDPDWSSEMKRSDLNFFDLVEQHKVAWPTVPMERGQGYKQFERFKWLYEYRVSENGHLPQGSDVIRMWNEVRSYSSNRSLAGNWQPLGPILDDVTTRDNIGGVGRVSCIAFHPTDPNIMIAGTPAGGVWRSTDGGLNWTTNTDWLPTLGISSLLIDQENPNIVYAGTGDRDAFDSPGMGVMKSLDGGLTWEFFNAGIEDHVVGGLKKIESLGVILAATNDGIYRSTDEGVTWDLVSINTSDYKDIELHPTDPNIVYATATGRFYRSEDAGLTFEQITEGMSFGSRMVIAVTPASPNLVYVVKTGTYSFSGCYRSTNAGISFEEMSDSPNIMGWAADGSSEGGQAWYDLAIEADWVNPDVIYVGGIRVKKSMDGGATWLDINPNYVHVDQHEFAINPHSQELYVCNDGGLYQYGDHASWIDISHGIVNGQIYKLGQSPHDGNHTLTGFQDNGTAEFNGAQWQRRGGGDGFECIYDHTDQSWRYGSIYYGDVYRTSPDFTNQKICGLDELGVTESGAWSSPYVLNPFNENVLYVGLKNVWRSMNVKTPEKDDIVWVKISNNLMGSNNQDLVALECSMADSSIMYASKGQRKLARTTNATDENVTWVNISSTLPSSLQTVTAIETHPTDTNIVYIAFNNNVWRSADQGASWTSLSTTLPDIPVNTIVLDTTGAPEALYIGTDLGIYYKDSLMTDWINFSNGFPYSSRVTELEIYYGNTPSENRIKASTYGRGLWESDLYSTETNYFPATALLSNTNATNEVFGEFEVELTFYRNLQTIAMSGVTADDIWASNAAVNSISGGPLNFTLNITPTDFGQIQLFVPTGIGFDENNMFNGSSDTLNLVYIPAPGPFGPYGPGGVGDAADLSLWLRADREVISTGNIPASDGSPVKTWNDISGNDFDAEQNTISRMPTYVENGIAGMPAIQMDGIDDYLQASDVLTGRSASAYIMVETDSIAFDEHGWFASARVPNGYLMHPWKNESQYHSEVLDLNEGYSGTPIYYIEDAAAPHIYGFIYEQDDLHQLFYTVFDDELYPFPGISTGERDNTTPIDIHFGWDFDDRYGQGRIAEHFLYRRRLMMSHHHIVNNYMAAKYGIDLGPLSKYHHSDLRNDVIGIGRENSYDLHTAAQGTGIILIHQATSLDNGDYLLIGTENASLNLTSDLFPILSERVERTWGVSQSGDVGTINLTIDPADLPNVPGLGIIYTEGQSFSVFEPVSFEAFTLVDGMYEATIDFAQEGVFTIGVQPTVGVPTLANAEVSIFPNPIQNNCTIQLTGYELNAGKVNVYNALGQIVSSSTMTGRSYTFDWTGTPAGWYTIEVLEGHDLIVRKPVLKY